jgi:hypothetical protein
MASVCRINIGWINSEIISAGPMTPTRFLPSMTGASVYTAVWGGIGSPKETELKMLKSVTPGIIAFLFLVLGFELRASHLEGKGSAT